MTKIEYIQIKDDPKIEVRVAKFYTKNEKYKSRHIIVIPGWLNTIDEFNKMAINLSNYGNIYIYEPRGYGKSKTPHKKGIFTPDAYNKELGTIIKALKLNEKEFILFGSCSGASQVFNYYINENGLKPDLIAAISPQEKYKTPFWLPALGLLPSFIMSFFQKMIIFFLNLMLKFKKPEETQNVRWAAKQLKENDAWCLRRYVFEFVINYSVQGRLNEIEIPMLMFVGEEDYFVDPETSKKFLNNENSKIVELKTDFHRIHMGNEEIMAEEFNDFLQELGR
ncbi:MAG: alpha/beta hydrolase [Candidatus Heimdallarchaeota archaeon]|nr:alpha/beta hydrolase [Candidatus Heimdallarchaeota archaeon]MCK5143106.1 alpha/beta hydrolase [Candidatus Heimdallarchaeota archaeon]